MLQHFGSAGHDFDSMLPEVCLEEMCVCGHVSAHARGRHVQIHEFAHTKDTDNFIASLSLQYCGMTTLILMRTFYTSPAVQKSHKIPAIYI